MNALRVSPILWPESKRIVVGGGLALLLGLLLLWSAPVRAQADPPHAAGLVVVDADGRVTTACVRFAEERLNGLELLRRANAQPVTAVNGGGAAVCSLLGGGCPATDCFCACKGAPCRYWAYFHLSADGTWAYSGVGAAAWSLGHGDVDAWVWGDGTQLPPALSFAEVCADPVPTPARTATPLPLLTPIPTPAGATPPPPAPWSYGLFAALALGLLALGLWRSRA